MQFFHADLLAVGRYFLAVKRFLAIGCWYYSCHCQLAKVSLYVCSFPDIRA
jgi:hypothetical protein